MDRPQENFVSMADTTLSVMRNNEAIWTASTPITNAMADAEAARGAIGGAVQGQQASSEGATRDKGDLQEAAIELGITIATLVQGYALDNENDTLYEQMRRYMRRPMDRTADSEVGDVLRDLHARVSALPATELADDYDVKPAMLTGLMTAITAYENAPQTPREIISARKAHTDSIPGNIAKLRAALVRVDKLIVRYEESQPEFVATYRNARIVIDLRGPGGPGVPGGGGGD